MITRFLLAPASVAAALALWSPPAHAQYYGDEPWCAVVAATDGGVVWRCYYRSVEECQPHVLAGDRGFCNVNPYGSHPAAARQTVPRHHKHRAAS
jgi:hypothetical protein